MGTTDDIIPRLLVSSFWKTCRLGNFIPWIEIVASENNPADAPSRGASSKIKLEFSKLKQPKFLGSIESLERYAILKKKVTRARFLPGKRKDPNIGPLLSRR